MTWPGETVIALFAELATEVPMPDPLTVIRHAERPTVTLPGGAAYQPIIGDDTGEGLPIRTGIQTSHQATRHRRTRIPMPRS